MGGRGRIKLPLHQVATLVFGYFKERVLVQVRTIALVVVYLAAFQLLILKLPLQQVFILAGGLGLTVLGLALFLEGVTLGLMPLGELVGARLPGKAKLAMVALFAFALGTGATFAEPALVTLRLVGSEVRPWEAPALYHFLNVRADLLTLVVSLGVGLGAAVGIVRFYLGWSLKPLVTILPMALVALSLVASWHPRASGLVGLAWDVGAVTTGPVTVPLILALGLGVCRSVGRGTNPLSGFGLIALASLTPNLLVLGLGIKLAHDLPAPMAREEFFHPTRRLEAVAIVGSPAEFERLLGQHGQMGNHGGATGGQPGSPDGGHAADSAERQPVIASVKPAPPAVFVAARPPPPPAQRLPNPFVAQLAESLRASLRAVTPLVALLLVFALLVLRARPAYGDEVALGLGLAILGMTMLATGNKFGLTKLGDEVGGNLPASFQQINQFGGGATIPNFDPATLERAVTKAGETIDFFHYVDGEAFRPVRFNPASLDPATGTYHLETKIGPIFESKAVGLLVVMLFAWAMGYGATRAEPSLRVMAAKVEEITVGIFRRQLLVMAVSVGVGIGMIAGVARLVWDVPTIWLLLPPYVALVPLTLLSDEEFVNIAWDAAGVTTGPVTVPLVLAMGLGLGKAVGVGDGFGVLALASVYPILAVLVVGLQAKARRRRAFQIEALSDRQAGGAE